MTQHFMVIGNPIAHSKSPLIHQQFAEQVGLDIRYARQFCPDDVESFWAVVEAFFNGGGVGANVTVPFKQVAYNLCIESGALSQHAKVAGAVNTLSMKNGNLFGDNTDGQGLVNHLHRLGWTATWQPYEAKNGAKVALIGAGGASRGVILPLIEAGVTDLTIANRTAHKAQTLTAELLPYLPTEVTLKSCGINELSGQFDLIINATSIGLTGDKLPLNDDLATNYAYDMMYGKALPFLAHFAKQGASVSDGLGMLIGQAKLSFEQWTEQTVDIAKIDMNYLRAV